MQHQLHTTTPIERRATSLHSPDREFKPRDPLPYAQLRVAVPDAAVRVVGAAQLRAKGGHLEGEAAGGAGDGVGGGGGGGAAVSGEGGGYEAGRGGGARREGGGCCEGRQGG